MDNISRNLKSAIYGRNFAKKEGDVVTAGHIEGNRLMHESLTYYKLKSVIYEYRNNCVQRR